MKKTNPLKVLIITESNIFFECIKRILIFTLKTEFIQNDDYKMLVQYPENIANIDLLVLDYRFREALYPGSLNSLLESYAKSVIFHIYAGTNCKIKSTDRIQVIRPDTVLKLIPGIELTWIDASEQQPAHTRNPLTRKENTIAKLISKGLNNKQIAKNQNISEKTVKAHLTSIYRKLNLKNRFELMLNAKNY